MTAQQQLRALLERGCVDLAHQVETVGRLLSQSPGGGAEADPITQAQAITHQIRGTSGSIGFMDLSAAATDLDENLKWLAKQPSGVAQAQLQFANELFSRLQKITSETTCEESTLYHADLGALARA